MGLGLSFTSRTSGSGTSSGGSSDPYGRGGPTYGGGGGESWRSTPSSSSMGGNRSSNPYDFAVPERETETTSSRRSSSRRSSLRRSGSSGDSRRQRARKMGSLNRTTSSEQRASEILNMYKKKAESADDERRRRRRLKREQREREREERERERERESQHGHQQQGQQKPKPKIDLRDPAELERNEERDQSSTAPQFSAQFTSAFGSNIHMGLDSLGIMDEDIQEDEIPEVEDTNDLNASKTQNSPDKPQHDREDNREHRHEVANTTSTNTVSGVSSSPTLHEKFGNLNLDPVGALGGAPQDERTSTDIAASPVAPSTHNQSTGIIDEVPSLQQSAVLDYSVDFEVDSPSSRLQQQKQNSTAIKHQKQLKSSGSASGIRSTGGKVPSSSHGEMTMTMSSSATQRITIMEKELQELRMELRRYREQEEDRKVREKEEAEKNKKVMRDAWMQHDGTRDAGTQTYVSSFAPIYSHEQPPPSSYYMGGRGSGGMFPDQPNYNGIFSGVPSTHLSPPVIPYNPFPTVAPSTYRFPTYLPTKSSLFYERSQKGTKNTNETTEAEKKGKEKGGKESSTQQSTDNDSPRSVLLTSSMFNAQLDLIRQHAEKCRAQTQAFRESFYYGGGPR